MNTRARPDFLWGAALGAHQSEGNNLASDWWVRENEPQSVVAERAGDAIDSYHRWRDDMDLVASAGLTDYRFGIEWSRVEPADGHISLASIGHYQRMVQGAVKRGLRPLITLHHFTLPQWFAAGGGWLRPDAVERFQRYVEVLAPVLESGVDRVETINEPNIVSIFPVISIGNGALSAGYPIPDAATTEAIIAAHHGAREVLRRNHPRILVGWGVSVQDFQDETNSREDFEAYVEPRDQVFFRAAAGDDWIGTQTYTRGRIRMHEGVAAPFREPGVSLTQSGWEDYPRALGGAILRVASIVGDLPIIVTENGIATADDARRISFTREALESMWSAIDDGVDVQGYFHWSLLDNWEWGSWRPTFGLASVDRQTFQRIPKPSLAWLGSYSR
ncbi:family 1 glycosylhydrolase [Herbiconiux sp. CPCC 205763]|uniref:beta-glucosidase n=1 Tax=Herbiconiux aconitum TaxID=2970913 RepID=A0ABT2GS29_9MICO|nr:family 1 glycosylhydrolase [Herbiconiux aconitum]MCS5717724.1 family 1 glycosylhydrolase [Herbiconiux aconitum]